MFTLPNRILMESPFSFMGGALRFRDVGNGSIATPALEQRGNVFRENLRTPALAEHPADHPAAHPAEAVMFEADFCSLRDGLERPGDSRMESAAAPGIDKPARRVGF